MGDDDQGYSPEASEAPPADQPSWHDDGSPQRIPEGDWSPPPADQPTWDDTGAPRPLPEGDSAPAPEE